MCGISAIVNLKPSPVLEQSLINMSSCQSHRGPDGSGTFISPDSRVGLAHKRLAIVDLTPGGHQPMHDSSRNTHITFNGEIYNFKLLRKSLREIGETFSSDSDTEVLLKGLSRLGPSFLDQIDGQFAFVFYNGEKNEILAGRDRFGEKPLYMYHHNSVFAFSSELNALEGLNLSLTFNEGNLQDFLLFQYFPSNRTPYNEVTKVVPGHYVQITKEGNLVTSRFDTKLTVGSEISYEKLSIDDAADKVEALLVESLRRRLESSDVEIGAFLSGGIDSSLVVAIATKKLGYKLNTFSIGFDNDTNSEHMVAQNISQILGTNHINKVINLEVNNFISEVIPKMDEPHGDFSNYPTYELCKVAAQHVKVAISGDGGDEIFNGYTRYKFPFQKQRANEKLFSGESYYSDLILTCDLADINQLYGGINEESVHRLETIRQEFDALRNKIGPLSAMRFSDINYYLPGAVLQKVDRMSMLNSLEVRTPFLQAELFKLSFSLPESMLINGNQSKFLLRYLLSRYLDKSITELPKKGFGLPSATWGQIEILAQVNTILKNHNSPIFEFIDIDRFSFMFDQMTSRAELYKPLFLWNIIVLNYWLAGRLR
jgi:asparagine synthase (glutamine-hydrolysing)